MVAESLHEYRDLKVNEGTVNEIFGLSQKEKDQKQSILTLGAKAKLEDISDDEMKKANEIGAIKAAISAVGIQRTNVITEDVVKTIQNNPVTDPIKYKQWAYEFIKYAAKLINGKVDKTVIQVYLTAPKDEKGQPIKDAVKVLAIAGQAGTPNLSGRVGSNA
jgi:hypothetical protein